MSKTTQGQTSGEKPTKVRYFVLALLFILTAINYLDRTNMAVAAPSMVKEFGFNSVTMGLIFSAFAWTYAFAQIPGGWFLDRVGSRVAYGISLFLWSLGTVFMGIGRGVTSLFGLRMLIGLFEAPAFPTNSRVVATWFPSSERGMATGIYTAGEFVGLAFLTPFLFWLSATYGWRTIFYFAGAIGILFSFVWYKFYRDPKESTSVNKAEIEYISQGGGLANKAGKAKKVTLAQLTELFKHRQLLGIYLGQFCIASTMYFFLTWFPTYLITEKHMPMLKAGIYATVPYMAAFVGVLIGGYWSDTMLRRGHSLSASRKIPIITGLICSTTIMAANYTNSFGMIIGIMSLAFFGQGMSGIAWSIVGDVAPVESLGLAGGAFNFCANLSGIVTPIAIGIIVQATHSFVGGMIFVSGIAVLGIFSYLFIVGDLHRIENVSEKAQ